MKYLNLSFNLLFSYLKISLMTHCHGGKVLFNTFDTFLVVPILHFVFLLLWNIQTVIHPDFIITYKFCKQKFSFSLSFMFFYSYEIKDFLFVLYVH